MTTPPNLRRAHDRLLAFHFDRSADGHPVFRTRPVLPPDVPRLPPREPRVTWGERIARWWRAW